MPVRAEQQRQVEVSPVVAVTPHKPTLADAGEESWDLLMTADPALSPNRKGLLERPLIVEGKRQRVPSLKVRMIKRQFQMSATSPGAAGDMPAEGGEEHTPDGSKKEKFHLFPKAPSTAPKTFNRAGPMKLQRRDKDGKESILTKRSGQIMLRKAKLQLNRTALNRSKAALARSLKAQLKREAKQRGKKPLPQRHSPRPRVTSPLSISVLGSGASHPFDSPNSQPSPLVASLSPGSQVGFASPPKIISSLSPISLPSKKEPGEMTADKPKETAKEKSESGGPRIKHVCRRAAVVLPKPLATFPAPPEPSMSMSPTLSALPSPEKERLLQSQAASRAEEKDSSDERQASPSKRSQVSRPAGMKKAKSRLGILKRKRKGRCHECTGCLAPNCGKCVYCLDSKKFGGKNILKKACLNRTCQRPIYTKRATEAFINPKGKGGEGDEVDSSQVRQGPSRLARPSASYFTAMSSQGQGEGTQDEEEGPREEKSEAPPQERPRQRAARGPHEEEGEGGGMNEGGLEIMSAVRMPRHVLTNHARRLLKRKEKAGLRVRLPTVVPQPQPLAALSTFWSLPPNTRSIVNTQLKENLDIDFAWGRGLSLTLAGPTCIRAVCFLCGSAGRQKLLYCSICCEPFHWYCLDEEDRPLEGVAENWCCRRCQFCHVCGLQTGLLQCDRCQDTYHPECLGPAYPKQPSRRNVWVCTKCVKCKSCGATTPGSGHNATWTYDFSLCFECGKLMDKGNFCPLCRKCYADDDWESKMVQCSMCESWVHARCEGLNDEMYQLFSYLPEDIQYRCRMCSPTDPPEWQTILHEELFRGLQSVITGITAFKCSSHLLVIDEAVSLGCLCENDDCIRGFIGFALGFWLTSRLKVKERLQRALQRKKPQLAICSGESVRTSPPEAVRSSLRVKKHTPSNTTDTADSQTNAQGQSHEDDLEDHKDDLATLTEKSDDCVVDVMAVSHSDKDSRAKSDNDSRPTRSNFNLGGSQVKAARMSEEGIFERVARSCEYLSEEGKPMCGEEKEGKEVCSQEEGMESPAKCENKTTEDKCLVAKPLSDAAGKCSDSSLSPTDSSHVSSTMPSTEASSVTAVAASEAPQTTAATTTSSNTATATEAATTLTGSSSTEEQASNMSDVATNKTPASISRNLFETFLAVSGTDEDETARDCSGEAGREQKGCSGDSSEQVSGKSNMEESDSAKDSASNAEAEPCAVPGTSKSSDSSQGCDNATVLGSTVPEHSSTPSSNAENSAPSRAPVSPSISPSAKKTDDTAVTNSIPTTDTASSRASLESSSDGSAVARTSSTPRSAERSVVRHVSVVEPEQSKAVVPHNDRQYPRDFNTIRRKLEAGKYTTVEAFNEDVVHIIQTALTDDEKFPTRRKQSNSVKTIFIKQMERVFPWFKVKACHLWQHNRSLPQGMLPDAVVPPHDDHTYAQWLVREITISSPQLSPFKSLMASPDGSANASEVQYSSEDLRQCVLCLELGDDFPDEAGRLLYAGQDDWVHINCALWSAEVFEESDGSLQNVHVAMVRGRQMRCDKCRNQGATVGCCMRGCPSNYHFLCARRQHCVFKEDKTVYCYLHREQANSLVENQVEFAVERRLCVNMADIRCMKKSWARGLDAAFVNILFGACTVESLGSLAPLSDCKGCLLPLDFRCSRVYWSTVDARQRTVYTCRIVEVRPTPSTPELTVRDVRIIHDQFHPDYMPLESLDLPSMGLSHLLPHNDDVIFVSQSSHGDSLPRRALPAPLQSQPTRTTASTGVEMCTCPTATELSVENRPTPLSKQGLFETSVASLDESRPSAFSPAKSGSNPVQCGKSLPESSNPSKTVTTVAAPSYDYSRLSPSTLKLLNITNPTQAKSRPLPSGPTPARSGELGNLAGMVQRLNSAAMRSRSNSCGQKQDGSAAAQDQQQQERNQRCSSVDRWTGPAPNPPALRIKRSVSLSPLGFAARPPSPFLSPQPGITSPPLFRRSPSPLDFGSSIIHVRKVPSITPILEQLESELMEKDYPEQKKAGLTFNRPSAPASREQFVDLTTEDEAAALVSTKTGSSTKNVAEREVVPTGETSVDPDVDADVEFAQQILDTVPKEILEGSEVKVFVVPDDVSEEEALRLAEEALLQTGNTEQEQTTLPEGEAISDGGADNRYDKMGEAQAENVVEEGDQATKKVEHTHTTEAVDEDCMIVDCDVSDSVSKSAPRAEHVVSGSKDIKLELLTDCDALTGGHTAVSIQSQHTNQSTNAPPPKTSGGASVSQHCGAASVANQSESLLPSPNQSENQVPSTSQSKSFIASMSKDVSTSRLKMSENLEVVPVFDKSGNQIGQRLRRPYIVETVKKTADAIEIERHHDPQSSRLIKTATERFRFALQKPTQLELIQSGTSASENHGTDTAGSHCEKSESENTEQKCEKKERAAVGDYECESKNENAQKVDNFAERVEADVGMNSPQSDADVEFMELVSDVGMNSPQSDADVEFMELVSDSEPSEKDADKEEIAADAENPTTHKTDLTDHREDAAPQLTVRDVRIDQVLSNAGESSGLDAAVHSSIILPQDVDAKKLNCSVSVHKLCLPCVDGVNVRDLCGECLSHTCKAGSCSKKSPKKSVSGDSTTEKLSVKMEAKDSESSKSTVQTAEEKEKKMQCSSESSSETMSHKEQTKDTESEKNSQKNKPLSIVTEVLVDSKCDVIKATNDKLTTSNTFSEGKDAQTLMTGSGSSKPLCNGLDVFETASQKDRLAEIALNPPPSVDKAIAESLRTIECHVSLERLSRPQSGSQPTSGESDSSHSANSHQYAQSNALHPVSHPPPASQQLPSAGSASHVQYSDSDNHAQNGASALSPLPSSASVTKAASASHSFNRSFMDFLKTPENTDEGQSPVETATVESAGTVDSVSEETSSNVTPETSAPDDVDLSTAVSAETEQSQETLSEWEVVSVESSTPSESKEAAVDIASMKVEEGEGEILPLHAEIALRIKAESLARSSPGESGPFKCPTCKRLYRTADSFHAHAQSCDFDVSTSDEDDDGEDGDGNNDEEKPDREEEKDEKSKKSLRSSLRESTLTQRKAMESSQQQLAQQAAEKVHAVTLLKSPKSSEGEEEVHRRPGRPRKLSSPSDKASPDIGGAETGPGSGRLKRLTLLTTEKPLVSPSSDSQLSPAEPVKRGRGRPRKTPLQSPEQSQTSPVVHSTQLSPKQSMLGAVGLVSRDSLEVQTANVKTLESPAARLRDRRPSAHSPSSVVRRCRSRKSSQVSGDAEKDVAGSWAQPENHALNSFFQTDSLLIPVSERLDLDSPAKTDCKPVVATNPERASLTMPSKTDSATREDQTKLAADPEKESLTIATSFNTKTDCVQDWKGTPNISAEITMDEHTEKSGASAKKAEPCESGSSKLPPEHKSSVSLEERSPNPRQISPVKYVETKDSDYDSDVICLDDEPTPSVSKHTTTSSVSGSSNLILRNFESSVPTQGLKFPTVASRLLQSTAWRSQNVSTGAEKHRTTSPILSRLASSLPASRMQTQPHDNVTGTVEKKAEITVNSPHPPTPIASIASSSSAATTPTPLYPSSTAPSSEADRSQSSLLLSSSNVQADIDSDDLSFTDSEDDETSMDTSPVPPPPRSSAPQINIRVDANSTHVTMAKADCPKTPEQQHANQLLSMLDKLSPDQKVVLTQQLLRKGALNIEDPSDKSRSQVNQMTPSQSPVLQHSKPLMVQVSQGMFVGQAQQAPQLISSSSGLRIVNTGSGMGQLTICPQQDSRHASLLQPMLVSQHQQQGASMMVHQRPGIVVRQPMIGHPITSLGQITSLAPSLSSPMVSVASVAPPQASFSASPTGGYTAGISTLGVPVSVGGSLLAHQAQPGVLCSQPQGLQSVLNTYHPQPVAVTCSQPQGLQSVLNAYHPQPVAVTAAQRVGYMGSFLVDPPKTSPVNMKEDKAHLQFMRLIQGVMTTTAATPAMQTVPFTSVAGSSVGGPSRVIRVVLDKSFNQDHNLASRLAPGSVRVVKVPPSIMPVASTMPSTDPLSLLSSSAYSGSIGAPTQYHTSLGVAQERSRPFLVQKRPIPAVFPTQGLPPAKRAMIVSADRNGIFQGQLGDSFPPSFLEPRMIQPALLSTPLQYASSSSGMQTQGNQANLPSSAHTKARKFAKGVAVSRGQANSALAGIRTLLKNKGKTGKQKITMIRKDASGSPAAARKAKTDVKIKKKLQRRPAKKKMEGGLLSHPIVHLSHQAGAMLPQAEAEEEIRDTPMKNAQNLPPSQQSNAACRPWPKDMPRLAFEISSEDGFSCRGETMEEAWRQVTDKVQDARAAARLKQMSYVGLNGVQMFGVGHDAVVYLVEQLAGAAHCRQYKFRHQDYQPLEDEELSINPRGSARCTPFTTRNPFDVFSFLMSRHRHRPSKAADGNRKEEEMEHKSSRRATSMELPMAMRFRKLQEHAKEAVGVYRSGIHGRGLFCKRNIDNGEMVIEYAGEIIRSLLTDKREKYYESKGIGCYMFRIDDCEVVDATMHGSAARFINHSCEPNCYSKVISVDGKKHIVIFASRAIRKGEELTYDYKFPIEEVKIPCSCGSRKCRKYLN
ncbi:platelet binding protein GspB-like [Littorina saxatilis]|uniref:platelet binding protein GspB-like n=1 Tax=Littorina saxatilis TaxID=31220 RepID=UPI0038B5299B